MNFKDVLKQLRFEDQIKFNNITKNQLRVICNISKECSKRGTNWKLIKDSSFVDYLLTAVNKRKGNTHAKILDTKVKVRTINKQVQTVRTYQKKTVLRKRFSLLTPKYKMARISIILQKLKSLVGETCRKHRKNRAFLVETLNDLRETFGNDIYITNIGPPC